MKLSRVNEEQLTEATKFAASNPLGMEIIVDNVVRGGNFGQISDGAKQIVKVDGNGTMSAFSKIMGSNYRPMKVKEFMRHVADFRSVGGFGEAKYHVENDGRRIFAFLPNEGKQWKLNGSIMDQSMIICTSFDGTLPLTIGGKTYFHRCSNMFSNITNAVKVRNSKFKMDEHILNYKAEIGGYLNQMNEFHENAQKLMECEFDEKGRNEVTKKILGIPKAVDLAWDEEKLKELGGIKGRSLTTLRELNESLNVEMNALGSNAWGYLNGVTRFTTHTKNNGEGHGVDAISMKYNNKAYKELIALV